MRLQFYTETSDFLPLVSGTIRNNGSLKTYNQRRVAGSAIRTVHGTEMNPTHVTEARVHSKSLSTGNVFGKFY